MFSKSKLNSLFVKAQEFSPVTAVVVKPESSVALEGAILAAKQKSIIPILIGDSEKIKTVAQEIKADISPYQIIDVNDDDLAAGVIDLVQQENAQAIIKGSLHSDDFMRIIVRKDSGLRTNRRMSHCQVIDIPAYKKLLILTDAALNTFPSFNAKKDIIYNAIDLAITLGISQPKVALISAVETVSPHIPNTAEWLKMSETLVSEAATEALIDGPLSLDLAISERSAKTKKLKSPVAGDADILVVPNVEVGNVLMKSMDYFAGALGLGIVLGAKIPVVLTSRAATAEVRAGSCMLAQFVSGVRNPV